MRETLFDLTDQLAVVTGAGSGLGRAMAEGLADFGARLCLLDVDLERGEKVSREIQAKGGFARAYGCDVGCQQQVSETAQSIIDEFGSVDILVNNAGIGRRNEALQMTLAEWNEVIRVNLTGVFLCSQSFGRHMCQRKKGCIINTASTAGVVALERNVNYCAAKAGVISLTRCLAYEWARYRVRVNAVAPTSFRTELTAPLYSDPHVYAGIVQRIPLGRVGEPLDIVGSVVFLASKASSMVTGHTLLVDGGWTIY